ncbi:hypothetical protein R3P38DRAFT_2660616 [Favolaschia claudopus]|uniref:Uncharacterized protein n=1 Tax=Favolaschia claudopus TaxID=2862362 RepID=A0AAV9ZRJ1_9AGAR
MFFLRCLLAALVSHTALALTPVGHTPSGKPIYVAPSGSRVKPVGRNMEVFAPNGSLIHTFVNVIPPTVTKGSHALAPRQTLSLAQATTPLTDPTNILESLNTSYTVPSAPTNFESQVIYLSANVVASDDNGVPFGMLRAVLQYGATSFWGGPYWTINTELEFLPDGGTLSISDPNFNNTVAVGTAISTSLVHMDEGDDIFWYAAGFDTAPEAPRLEVGWSTPVSVAVGLEEEGVTQRSSYPAESFTFSQTSLTLTNGAPKISWDLSSDPSTGAYITADVDGSENAELSVHFGN